MDIRWTFEHSDLLTFWFRWPGVKVRVAQDAGTYIWACSVSHIPAKALCCGHWPKPAVQSTPTGIWRAVRAPAGKMETIEWPSGISLVFFSNVLILYSKGRLTLFKYLKKDVQVRKECLYPGSSLTCTGDTQGVQALCDDGETLLPVPVVRWSAQWTHIVRLTLSRGIQRQEPD